MKDLVIKQDVLGIKKMTEKHQVLDQAILDSERYSQGYVAGLKKAADICERLTKEARDTYYNIPAIGMDVCRVEILKELEEFTVNHQL